VFVIINVRNRDRLSRPYETKSEALSVLSEAIHAGEDPDRLAVCELDDQANLVGEPITLADAAA
jgi:hypothetical protein